MINNEINRLLKIMLSNYQYNISLFIQSKAHREGEMIKHLDAVITELERLDALSVKKDGDDNTYLLIEPVRKKLNDRPVKYLDKPYEYLLYLEEKEKADERKEKWPKRNWFWADLIKIAVGFAIGFLFRLITEPKNIQQQDQNKTFQQSPKTTDTLHTN